jgi:hypothetical protein
MITTGSTPASPTPIIRKCQVSRFANDYAMTLRHWDTARGHLRAAQRVRHFIRNDQGLTITS